MIVSDWFLKTISRTGHGRGLLHAARFDALDRERPDFILNRMPWRDAEMPIALDNFGIRVIIAPSFADIFIITALRMAPCRSACTTPSSMHLYLLTSNPETAKAQKVAGGTLTFDFDIATTLRGRLMGGLDDIANALRFDRGVAAHEALARAESSWLADSRLQKVLF